MDKALSTMSDGEKTQVLNEIFNKVDLKSVNALLANSGERFDELSGYIDNASGACATMADTMNDNLQGRITQLQSAAEGLGIQIYESIETPLKEAAEGGIDAIGQLSEALESGGFSGMVEQIGTLLAQGLVSIAEYAPQFIQAAVLVIQSFIQGITENLPAISESAISICGSLLEGFTTVIPSLLDMGVEIVRNLASGITSNQSSISDSVSTIMDSLVDSITEALPYVIDGGIGVVTSLIDGISQSLPNLISKGSDMVLSIIEGITDNLDSVIDSGLKLIQSLVEGIEQNLPKLLEKGPELVSKLVDKIVENLPKIIETATKIVVQLATTLIQNAPKMLQSAQTLMTSLITSLLTHLPQIIEAGFKMIGELAAGLIKNIPAIIKAIADIVKSIFDGFKGVDLITIGKQIIQGLINGIKSMVKSVGGAIAGLCNDAVNAAKSALGIHSPSKVFKEEVGVYVGQGMAKGINESKGEVTKSTKDMCNAALNIGLEMHTKQTKQEKALTKAKKEQYKQRKADLMEYLKEKQEQNAISLEDQKYIYQQLIQMAKGNKEEQKKLNAEMLKLDEEMYQKKYQASKDFIADKKYYNQLSLKDELAAYERMKAYSKGHAEETKEIEKEIYRVKKEIKAKEVEDVKNNNSKILAALKDRVDKEKEIITGNRDSAVDALQKQLDAIDEAEEKRQNDITQAGYETEIQKLQDQLSNAVDPEEVQKINEQLYDKQQAFDEWKYQQELKAKKQAIKDQMEEVRNQASQEIDAKEKEYEQQKAMLEKNQEEMINYIQSGGNKVLNIQDANAVLAMGINKSLTEDKQNNLDQQYEAVIDNENKSAQAVEDACVEMYRKNYKMGVQMANGIADGILNQTWRAVKAVGMMCDKMIAETKKKLDIHSPSKVFKKLGSFVGHGMSDGIDSETGNVVGSMASMCKKLTDSVDVNNLVDRLSAAVNGEVSILGDRMSVAAGNNIATNTVTNNNTNQMPITVNNYGSTSEGKDLGRELGNRVSRELRGRGVTAW